VGGKNMGDGTSHTLITKVQQENELSDLLVGLTLPVEFNTSNRRNQLVLHYPIFTDVDRIQKLQTYLTTIITELYCGRLLYDDQSQKMCVDNVPTLKIYFSISVSGECFVTAEALQQNRETGMQILEKAYEKINQAAAMQSYT
jgi:hypothetical protein